MKRSKCLSLINVNIDIDKLLDIWENQNITKASEAFNYAITEGKPILTDVERMADVIGILDLDNSENDKKKKSPKSKPRTSSIVDEIIDSDITTIIKTAEIDNGGVLAFGDYDDW